MITIALGLYQFLLCDTATLQSKVRMHLLCNFVNVYMIMLSCIPNQNKNIRCLWCNCTKSCMGTSCRL